MSRGYQTNEPEGVRREFRDKHDWRTLKADFIDRAPMGMASALSFFSDAAHRFYLPAYLIADIQQQLERVDLPIHITSYLTDDSFFSTDEQNRWMLNNTLNRYSLFTQQEVLAIIAYLEHVAYADDAYSRFDRVHAVQALNNYWYERQKLARR